VKSFIFGGGAIREEIEPFNGDSSDERHSLSDRGVHGKELSGNRRKLRTRRLMILACKNGRHCDDKNRDSHYY
jgi:hypothetical protein